MTTAALTPNPKFHGYDSTGAPLASGKLSTYATGTSTPKSTYPTKADAEAGTNANANPTILDSRGEANVWCAGDALYRFTLTTSADAAVWGPVDGVGNIVLADLAAATGSTLVSHSDGAGGSTRTVAAVLRGTVRASDKGFDAGATGAVNSTALQAALNTGKHVEVEDGSYTLASGLTLDTAGQSLVFQSRNAILTAATDFDMFTVNNSFVNIRNGKLVGAAASTASTSAGIRMMATTRNLIDDLYVGGFGYGARGQGGTSNWTNYRGNYFYGNKRSGIYGMGNGSSIDGGEIANCPYGVLQAALQAGAALAIDRDSVATIGQGIVINTLIEAIGVATGDVIGTADNGAGLVRINHVAHGFTTGDCISISGIVGTTEANGVWPITVISADLYDLQTSAYAVGWASGGTVRRGVGLYWGVGKSGPCVTLSDCEDVPIVIQLGDAFKNNGSTAHTALVSGGSIAVGSYNSNAVESCLVMNNRSRNFRVVSNNSSGTKTTKINNRGANAVYEIWAQANEGFTKEYESTGTQASQGPIYKPPSKNNALVASWQVPTSSTDQTLVTTLKVSTTVAAVNTVLCDHGLRVLGQIQRGSTSVLMLFGAGSPEGSVTAAIGSIYQRSDGGAGTSLYQKVSGAGNTLWTAIA